MKRPCKSNSTFLKQSFPMAFSPQRAEGCSGEFYTEMEEGIFFSSILGKTQAPLGCEDGRSCRVIPFFTRNNSDLWEFLRFRVVWRSTP